MKFNERWSFRDGRRFLLRNTKRSDLHPISITQMENIFSVLVFGETLPNPTLVKLLSVKYKAVTYFDCKSGPLVMSLLLYG